MDQNSWVMLLLGIAVSCGVIALGVVLYPKLRSEKQGYPFEAQIEAALLPLIFQGICAAYRVSEKGMDDCRQRLKGMDKQEIAKSIYAMLPDKIGIFDIIVVKRIVPEQRFNELVQNAFDHFDRFFIEHQTHFEDQFEKWKESSQPAAPQSAIP